MKTYAAVIAEYRVVSEAYRKAAEAFRAGKINDSEFLAARHAMALADEVADIAERDEKAVASHVEFLNAERAAVSLCATLPSGASVTVFRDGRVVPVGA